jgi:hypothetical protein
VNGSSSSSSDRPRLSAAYLARVEGKPRAPRPKPARKRFRLVLHVHHHHAPVDQSSARVPAVLIPLLLVTLLVLVAAIILLSALFPS